MKRTRFVRASAIAVALAGITATPIYAQGSSTKAHVEVLLLSTSRTGATGNTFARTGRDLAVGETWTTGVCGSFSGSRGAGGWPIGEAGDHAWRVEARLVSIQVDTVEVAISWGRYRPGAGHQAPEVGDDRIVKLMTGQRHVLDLVQSDTSVSPIANLGVEIDARQVEDPAYANASIGYDVWFVHESRAGQKTTRRVQSVGAQGEWKAFSFRPLGFSLDRVPLPADAIAPVVAYMDGEVLGRLRPDGAIGLVIRNGFGIDCAVAGNDGGSGPRRTGGQGEKELVVRDGETVSLEQPTRIGWCTIVPPPSIPANARPGVTAVKDGLRITGAEFFGGERFSLLVTARRRN